MADVERWSSELDSFLHILNYFESKGGLVFRVDTAQDGLFEGYEGLYHYCPVRKSLKVSWLEKSVSLKFVANSASS